MKKSEVEQFLAGIKGNTYRVDGEKVKVESTSIHPKTGRVLITTNKWSRFWLAGNTSFTKLFTEPIKPGTYMPPVVQREPEQPKPVKPAVYLRKGEVDYLAATEQLADEKPTLLQSAFTAAKPKKHTYIRDRVMDLMKLRGYDIRQLATKMGLAYERSWTTLRTCDKSISLGRLQELAVGLEVSLPYLVSNEPITNESMELHTVNYHTHG